MLNTPKGPLYSKLIPNLQAKITRGQVYRRLFHFVSGHLLRKTMLCDTCYVWARFFNWAGRDNSVPPGLRSPSGSLFPACPNHISWLGLKALVTLKDWLALHKESCCCIPMTYR